MMDESLEDECVEYVMKEIAHEYAQHFPAEYAPFGEDGLLNNE